MQGGSFWEEGGGEKQDGKKSTKTDTGKDMEKTNSCLVGFGSVFRDNLPWGVLLFAWASGFLCVRAVGCFFIWQNGFLCI